jgi:D-alanine transaminase
MKTPLVYLNGDFLPLDEAKISVLDRGFLFGDGVYEVIPAYGGYLFRLKQHLMRLDNSLRGIGIEPPLNAQAWQDILEKLLVPDQSDQAIYLQITRGVGPNRDHKIPAGIRPTLFAMANPIPTPDPEKQALGIRAITLDDIRWAYCHIKAITLLPNVLLKKEAFDQGATEAILVRDGQALEGAASNLFIIEQGRLITPPNSNLLLPGITRDLVLEVATDIGWTVTEEAISLTQLMHAEEVWLTSSTKEIMAVTQVDDQTIGSGQPGPRWQAMTHAYQRLKEQLRQGLIP